MQGSAEPKETAAMEEWVLLGESGSDADSVQYVDGSHDGSDSEKGSEMSFTTVQIGGSRRAADALDSSVEDLLSGGNEDEEESNGDYGYFDLDLPALAGSKAVFGASGVCFDPNLAASILSMGSVGYDTGIHGGQYKDTDSDGSEEEQPESYYNDIDTESSDPAESDYPDDIEHSDAVMEQPESYSCGRRLDDIDTESLCVDDDDDDIFTESSEADEEQPESCSRGRHLDDIDTESICAVHDDDIAKESDYEQMMARVRAAMQYIARATPQVSRFVSETTPSIEGSPDDENDTESFDDAAESEDTESSDEEESDAEESEYTDDGTESTDTEESDYSDDCTEISDEEESEADDDDTESSDAEESDDRDDDTEISVASGTTGGGDDAKNSENPFSLERLRRLRRLVAMASTSPPPTAPHLFFPNAGLFMPTRAGTSTAASPPPCAPHLYFRNRAD